MPTRDGYAEGIPSWVDLGTPDVEGAKAFYNAVLGWDYREEETASSPYSTALIKGLPVAGIGPLQDEGMPTAWTTYFAVDDADATVSRIKEAGGSVMLEPSDVTKAGRLAIAADPTGAVFGIWQAGTQFGAAIVNEHGALNWNELLTDDIDAATPFYRRALGHETETSDAGDGSSYTSFKVGDRAIAGGRAKPRADLPNHWNVYFAVADTEAAMEQVKAHEGSVLFGPSEMEDVGIFAGFVDPYGAPFMVVQLANEID